MKKIAILTSGGDSPGMNAAIRAAGKYALSQGLIVYGIQRGYSGMLNNDIFLMDDCFLSGIIDKGGTKLLTARCLEFLEPEFRAIAAQNMIKKGIEGLIVIGGDGSYRGADLLSKEHGIHVVGIPGTIDNDIIGTDYTIGFDTCLNTILDAISKIRDTATSHERTILIEVMGHNSGDLALYSCLAGGGDGLLIPEMKNPIEMLALQIKGRRKIGKLHDIILVAEGVGSVHEIEKKLASLLGAEVRSVVLGHVQRGGTPSGFDRVLATRMAVKSVDILLQNSGSVMVGIEGNRIITHPISFAWEGKKTSSIYEDFEITNILSK